MCKCGEVMVQVGPQDEDAKWSPLARWQNGTITDLRSCMRAAHPGQSPHAGDVLVQWEEHVLAKPKKQGRVNEMDGQTKCHRNGKSRCL